MWKDVKQRHFCWFVPSVFMIVNDIQSESCLLHCSILSFNYSIGGWRANTEQLQRDFFESQSVKWTGKKQFHTLNSSCLLARLRSSLLKKVSFSTEWKKK